MEFAIKNSKVQQILITVISCLFCMVMGFITACALFADGGYFSIAKNNALLAIVGGVLLMVALSIIWRKLSRKPEVQPKTERKIAGILFSLIAILIGVIVYYLHTDNPTWDPKYVSIGAEGVMYGKDLPEYLSIYPFNLTLSFLAIPIVWIIGTFHIGLEINTALSIASGVIVFLSFVVIYLTLRLISSKNKALFALFLMTLFAPFILYCPIFYSDTISCFLIYLLLYLLAKNIKQYNQISFPKKMVYAAAIGLIVSLMIQVKATTAIVAIAIVIAAVIYLIGKKFSFKKAIAIALICSIFFVLPTIGIKYAIAKHTDASMAHPISNWIAMGLSGTGGYNDEDANRTTELLRAGEDANTVNIEVIKDRIRAYGVKGFFVHQVVKTAAVWGCGDIGTARALSPDPHHYSVLSEIVRDGGSYNRTYLKVANIVWVSVLLTLFIGSILDIKNKQSVYKTFAKLTIIGVFLFLEFWETQSRYLYIFLPILLSLAIYMMYEMIDGDIVRNIVLTVRGGVKYLGENHRYRKIQILDTACTMRQIKKGKSVIRLGDGEMAVMLGHSIWFQKQSEGLKEDLEEVLKRASDKKMLVCVPRTIISMAGYRLKARCFWCRELMGTRHEWKKRLLEKNRYGETSVTRARTDLNRHIQDEVFVQWREVFAERDIVVIEGGVTRTGVGNDLFEKAKSVKRIIGPSKNAYDKVPQITKAFEVEKVKKSTLILVSLGPAAKKIAMELHDKGYQVIDLGHLGQEYAFYYNGKYRKSEDDDRFDKVTDSKYEKSIIARIKK